MRKSVITLLVLAGLALGLCAGAAQAEGTPAQLIYTEPYMVTLNPSTEMNIIWLTRSGNASGIVEYGPTPALGHEVTAEQFQIVGLRTSATPEGYAGMDESFPLPSYTADPAQNPEVEVYQLIAKLENLMPGSMVYYRVTTTEGDVAQQGERYFFKTAPAKGESFDFVLLSDMQQRVKTRETLHLMGQQKKDFILFAGDLVNVPWKVGEWFNYEGCYQEEGEDDRSFFECLSQNDDNCRLMQYTPIFFAPGNHEINDQRFMLDVDIATDFDGYSWSIYMQMFRPLYPEQEYGVNGKRWYSADYGDLHINSIAVHRAYFWDGFTAPGWFTFSDISSDSDQVKWLQRDLATSDARYKWVVMHWHMIHRGDDGWVPTSEPVADADDPTRVSYPNGDYCYDVLRPVFEQYGVNAVNFGHSHVYERYLVNDVHYIEAASIGSNQRVASDPYHFSGNLPVIEANEYRSFMLVNVGPDGMTAKGVQSSVEDNGIGYIGRVIEEFTIAE